MQNPAYANPLQERLLERAVQQFMALGYDEVLDGDAEYGGQLTVTGRERANEVVLPEHLHGALAKFNPRLANELRDQAYGKLTRELNLLSEVTANQIVHDWLKDGIRLNPEQVAAQDKPRPRPGQLLTALSVEQEAQAPLVNVINWKNPEQNRFVLVRNFWLTGRTGRVRLDLVGFVNGLPLLLPLVKLGRLQDLYDVELAAYRHNLAPLFWYNALILLSTGNNSRVGSMTASWEYFFEWKRVADEHEDESSSLETLLQGTCAPRRLLDMLANFTLFSSEVGGTRKLIARNHQYLGVNAAIERLKWLSDCRQHPELIDCQGEQGKLGVFWHTQGSGKSYSMVFFYQKVRRTLPGNWRFVVVTDRDDLDRQIYTTFHKVGVIIEGEKEAHAADSEHLRLLLGTDRNIVFTLIQKFRTEVAGQEYPIISERADIIVMADEAHRTQYAKFAENMRKGLAQAAFLGFTGTPLIDEEVERTRAEFGDYVSIYNFTQAILDKTTVRLIYENHTPMLQRGQTEFSAAMKKLVAERALTDEEERKVRRGALREYAILANDARLEEVARDIVEHFMGRGYRGKAMVVSIDKPTTMRMYEKVQRYWLAYLADLERQLVETTALGQREDLVSTINYMRQTDMAVIISDIAPDDERFADYSIDPAVHLNRLHHEDLEKKFKREDHLVQLNANELALRIVFVCGMWITGFDVPCLSTIYLDRPMRGHALMQTIARANRIFEPEKSVGVIIDYVGSFSDLTDALAIYATNPDPRANDLPIGEKSELVAQLRQAMTDLESFCDQRGLNVAARLNVLAHVRAVAERSDTIEEAANQLLRNDDTRQHYLALAAEVRRLYKAILPDPLAQSYYPLVYLFRCIELAILDAIQCTDIADILSEAHQLVADAVVAGEHILRETAGDLQQPAGQFDLNKLDFDYLEQCLREKRMHLKAAQLRNLLSRKAEEMARVNPSRMDYLEKLQSIIDKYNEQSANFADYPRELVDFARELRKEEQRAAHEQLSEEELAIFDLLTRPGLNLSESESQQVKAAARTLLASLKRDKLGEDWAKKRETKGEVIDTIKRILDEQLPPVYDRPVYELKCGEIYQYIEALYPGDNRGSSFVA